MDGLDPYDHKKNMKEAHDTAVWLMEHGGLPKNVWTSKDPLLGQKIGAWNEILVRLVRACKEAGVDLR